MTWLVFAAVFAGLLGVSFGRTRRTLRQGHRARAQLGAADEEWQRRTLDVVIAGTGEVPIAMELSVSKGTAIQFRMIATDGTEIEVPAGILIEVAMPLRARDGTLHLLANHPYSAFISSYVPGDGPLRTSHRVPTGARVVLHERGWNPVRHVARLLHKRWRWSRVGLFVAVPGAIVALIAASTSWLWLGLVAAGVLTFDAVFLRSALVSLTTTTDGRRALSEPR